MGKEWDGIKKMKEWIIENALVEEKELDEIVLAAKEHVKDSKIAAWEKFITPVKNQVARATDLMNAMATAIPEHTPALQKMAVDLSVIRDPLRRDILKTLNAALNVAGNADAAFWARDYYNDLLAENKNYTIPSYTMKGQRVL